MDMAFGVMIGKVAVLGLLQRIAGMIFTISRSHTTPTG